MEADGRVTLGLGHCRLPVNTKVPEGHQCSFLNLPTLQVIISVHNWAQEMSVKDLIQYLIESAEESVDSTGN